MTKPMGTDLDFANFMLHNYWAWSHRSEGHLLSKTVTFNIDGLEADRAPIALAAFQQWDAYTSLTFVQVHDGGAMIMVDDLPDGAYTDYVRDAEYMTLQAKINVSDWWSGGADHPYVGQTFAHEIGHALGLGHTGPYNGNAAWGVDNYFENDSWGISIMSYFGNSPADPNHYYPYVNHPMSADVLAAEMRYDLSDLTITGFSRTPQVLTYENNHLSYTITNVGTEAAAASVATVSSGGQNVFRVTPGLAPGQSFTDNFDWDFLTAGSQAISVTANTNRGEGFELSRYNNAATVGVEVLAHGSLNGGFDQTFYLSQYADVAQYWAGDPKQHYDLAGWHEGRDPSALFDTSYYLSIYTDVAAAGINPLWHYEQIGWQEGRNPSARFDTSDYLAYYGDVAAAHINPLDHYLTWGIYEGRNLFPAT